MKILIAPDKFKGSLSAVEAANAIQQGFSKVFPKAHYVKHPLADGGDGFVNALVTVTNGHKTYVKVYNALMKPCQSHYGWLGDKTTAVIELALASGLVQLKPHERNPLRTTTFGVGQLILHAVKSGAKRILIGIGGSATNDGGTGIATALGFRFLDKKNQFLPHGGGALVNLAKIESPSTFNLPPILVGCDVRNKLLGKEGASAVFGPQKGATPQMVRHLDLALRNLSRIAHSRAENIPGSGAAGGAGYGLMTFCHAKMISGFELVSKYTGLEKHLNDADLIITGEGSLDQQTFSGKAPECLRILGAKKKIPILALAGQVEKARPFDAALAIPPAPADLEQCVKNAKQWLTATAEEMARLIQIGNLFRKNKNL